jgi:hypothetical protein
MNINQLHKEICLQIFRVIELCYSQGVTTTWRDIYLFLRLPKNIWEGDTDLDEKIIVSSDQELEMIKALLLSKFETRH